MEIVIHFDIIVKLCRATQFCQSNWAGQAPEKSPKMDLKMQHLDKSYKIPKIVLEFWLE